ncbi:MAG: hypothetical protein FRX48_06841 [Lasallia pustulata]|uniref:Integrase zinc-binding domain-containing protein n=1 Tax=Lasallia pustulata TaxID=136370 RepID=A0A5M8PK91_9LECA|nr:MAG: hypothetical protein FRX48_06841 [Lasallia pustulata]
MDGGMTGTPAVRNLHAREASRDGYTSTTYTEAGSTTGTPAVRNLYAREASCDGDAMVQRDNVVPNINMDGGMTGTPAVRNLHAREASRDEYTSTMHTEAGGTTGTLAVHNLYAQEASCDGDAVVRQDNVVPNINMDGGMTGTPAVYNLYAREASRDGDAVVGQDNVVPNINIDGGTTGKPAVWGLHAQEASRDGYTSTTYTEAGGTTGTPAVRNLYAQEASCDGDAVVQRDNVIPNINMDGSTTGTPAVPNLYAQEASHDGDAVVRRDNIVPNINMDVGRPGYPEAQHRSIEDSAADAEAMDFDDTIDNDPISLQIEAGASDKNDQSTLACSYSFTNWWRGNGLYNLVRQVQQGLATPIKDRPNLAGSEMANAVPGTANMVTNMAATMASIWSRWQEIDNIIYYDGKIYILQNTALRNAVISRYHNNIFAGHFGKSRTAKLMQQTHDWPGAVRDVQRYCHNYVKCQKAKPAHHKPLGPALEQHLWKYDMYSEYNSRRAEYSMYSKYGMYSEYNTCSKYNSCKVYSTYSKYGMYSKYNMYGKDDSCRVAARTASTTFTASTISRTRHLIKLPQWMTKL